MQTQATQQFKLTAVIDGSTYAGSIKFSDDSPKKNFLQFVNDGGEVMAAYNWNGGGPKFYMKVVDTASGNELVATDVVLSYNGTAVTFGADGQSNNVPVSIKKTEESLTIGGSDRQVTCFQFTDNVAGPGNMDNDALFLTGTIKVSGNDITVQTPEQQVQVVVTGSGSSYRLEVTGDDIVKGANQSSLRAVLYGPNGVLTSGVTYSWRKDYPNNSQISGGNQQSLTIHESDVSGVTVFFCVATYNGETFVCSRQVVDFNDPLRVDIVVSGVANDGYIAKSDTNVVITPILRESNGTASSKRATFAWVLYNAKNEQVNLDPYLTTETGVIHLGTNGYNWVTETCGGSITGYVTATIG